MCQLLEVSKSGYYAWRTRPESQRAKEDKELLEEIQRIYEESRGLYGSPRITQALKKTGKTCGKNRIAKLMSKNGIKAKTVKKFKATTNSKHDYPVADRVFTKDMNIDKLNKVWVGDITYIATGEGWLYLATFIDLYSRKVVGWSMDKTMPTKLCTDALKMAYNRQNPPEGVIYHSDRGKQYASFEFRKLLKAYGMQASLSRKGNCYDNAYAETFFGTLKTELIYLSRFRTRAEAQAAVFEYIEVFYNRKRMHSAIGYMSPAEFELTPSA